MPRINKHKWEFPPSTTKAALAQLNLSLNKLAWRLRERGVQITPQQLANYFNGANRVRDDVWTELDFLRQKCREILKAEIDKVLEGVESYL